MSEKQKYSELSDGRKMPLMGYGTFSAEEEKDLHACIVHAVVECGYRLIDTAALYGNEEIIGDALQECFEKGIKREDIWVTTKIWRTDFNDVEGAIKTSLQKLKLDYVDLYLVHWMVADVDWDNAEVKGPPIHEIWANMEKIHDAGLSKSIGISNCSAMLFLDMLTYAKVKLVVNQIETNPHFSQVPLIELSKKFGIATTAYAPMGAASFTGNDLLEDETIKEIATKHNATVAQICLAWNLNRGVAVIPKSTNKERMQQNFDSLDIKLDAGDVERIDGLNQNKRKFDPYLWNDDNIGWRNSAIFS